MRVEQLRWKRISVPGNGNENEKEKEEGGEKEYGHEHAFWRDGEEKRIVNVVVRFLFFFRFLVFFFLLEKD